MTPLPKALRTLTLVLSAAVVLQALAMMVFAFIAGARPIWILFGFEVVVAVCALLGVFFAKGRFEEGQGLAAISIGGSIALCSFLAWLAISKITLSLAGAPLIVKSYLLTRLAVGFWFVLVACLAVLTRNPASGPFVRGAAISGGLLGVLGGVGFVFRAGISGWLNSASGGIRGVVTSVLVVAVGVLVCALGHCLIRAFELGRTRPGAGGQAA